MSSSSPPQPQNEFENPFNTSKCSRFMADTPPKIAGYGNLQTTNHTRTTPPRTLTIPILEDIHGDAHVPRLPRRTRVQVAVVLGQEIDVVENEAVVTPDLERLLETHVHEHGAVERPVAVLLHDVDGVVELLPLQKRVHVLQEQQQVFPATPKGDDEGDALRDSAGLGCPMPADFQPGEALLELEHGGDWSLEDFDSAAYHYHHYCYYYHCGGLT